MITVGNVECQESYGHYDSQDLRRTKESEQTNGNCQQFVDCGHLVYWNTASCEQM